MFFQKNFVEQVQGFNLHLVNKHLNDADLSYFSNIAEIGRKCRTKKYAEMVDAKNLNPEHFKRFEDHSSIKTFSGIVYSKFSGRNNLHIVEEFQIKGKTISQLLFSTETDCALFAVAGI